ncbi:hypothetical protein Lepto7376_0910 [[Leptolyngbya] sp. PCC 7376]|uniref:PTPA-CTERM sorting domain-containing protein n=1 Tax=[Leptolyngbya] sp. PCC 7376 TaxID=111781 RepID=UPI00029F4962|nr:PTPA-CTERM sorting domain-containing protein [[Leptolyngbya] sp. PCC 7376]AFY37284.1 hypothetical protein Lepto7376_0910 [[Leptolyngbya] sp. PCC 7376]
MNVKKVLGLGLVVTGAIAGSFLADVKPADAFVVKDGWNYEIDTFNDGLGFNRHGNSGYEIYGMAYKVANGITTIAINSNMDLEDGRSNGASDDGRLDFGDLIFNFSGDDLQTASENADLFGIRFAPNSDSLVPVGVYSDVTAQMAAGNYHQKNLKKYNKKLSNKGVTASIGDGSIFKNDDAYFGGELAQPLNSIASGTKVGDIDMLDVEEVASLGLDFGYFHPSRKEGVHTIAFTFESGFFPRGKGLYHLGFECNNDVIGGAFEGEAVPTPAVILPTILGMFGAASRKKDAEDELA